MICVVPATAVTVPRVSAPVRRSAPPPRLIAAASLMRLALTEFPLSTQEARVGREIDGDIAVVEAHRTRAPRFENGVRIEIDRAGDRIRPAAQIEWVIVVRAEDVQRDAGA